MAELLLGHREQIERLVSGSLNVIEDSLEARREIITPLGVQVDAGADHFARLAGAKRLIELVQSARADASSAGQPQTITWELFLSLYQEARPG